MNRSLSKVLARMAKDGDTETVAEIIEEMIAPADPVPETPAPAEEAEQPAEAAEPGETTNIIIDEEGLAGVLERLDRIISLLEPAAADEAPEETVAGIIGEALEEAVLGEQDPIAGEVSAVMEEVLDPLDASLPEPEEDEEEALPETLQTRDALRAALTAVRPALARMPRKQRNRVAGDIAARLWRSGSRGASDSEVYAALASATRRTAPASAELGKRIMEKRNSAYACRRGE